MIKTFADKETKRVFHGRSSRKLPGDIQARAHRKLLILDQARSLQDLRVPPGNQLEVLKGDRARQHSIRINRQWRICFLWRDADAFDVEITDYHA